MKILNIAFKVLLAGAIIGVLVLAVNSIMRPIEEKEEVEKRYAAVKKRMKDLRTAQEFFFDKYGRYTDELDSLVWFVKNDTLITTKQVGNTEDSVLVAEGKAFVDTIYSVVKDELFPDYTDQQIDSLPYIPYTENVKFRLETGNVAGLPVFLIEDAQPYDREDTLRVGSLKKVVPNNAGNWEL